MGQSETRSQAPPVSQVEVCKDVRKTFLLKSIISNFGFEGKLINVLWRDGSSTADVRHHQCIVKSTDQFSTPFIVQDSEGEWKIEKITNATLFTITRVNQKKLYLDSKVELFPNMLAQPSSSHSKKVVLGPETTLETTKSSKNKDTFARKPCTTKKKTLIFKEDVAKNVSHKPSKKKKTETKELKDIRKESCSNETTSKKFSGKDLVQDNLVSNDDSLGQFHSFLSLDEVVEPEKERGLLVPRDNIEGNVDEEVVELHYSANVSDKQLEGIYQKLPKMCDPLLGLVGFQPDLNSALRRELCIEWSMRSRGGDKPLASPEESVVLAVGGINPLDPRDYELSGSVLRYQPALDRWERACHLPEPRWGHACVFSSPNHLLVIGGLCPFLRRRGDFLPTPTTYCLDTTTRRWTRLGNLNQARAYFGAAVLSGEVWAVGGRGLSGALLRSVEVLRGRQWEHRAPLPHPTMGCAVTAAEGSLWVVGGVGVVGPFRFLDTVLRLRPSEGHWTTIPSLPRARAFSTAAWLREKLWVCGGLSNGTSLSSVEVWCPRQGNWQSQPSLAVPRHALAMCPIDDSVLLAAGGVSSRSMSGVAHVEHVFTVRPTSAALAPLPAPLAAMALVALPPVGH